MFDEEERREGETDFEQVPRVADDVEEEAPACDLCLASAPDHDVERLREVIEELDDEGQDADLVLLITPPIPSAVDDLGRRREAALPRLRSDPVHTVRHWTQGAEPPPLLALVIPLSPVLDDPRTGHRPLVRLLLEHAVQ